MGTAQRPMNGQPDTRAAGAAPAEALGNLSGKLLDLLPGAVYVCDHEGVLVRWNRQAVDLWGREPKPGDRSERFCGSFKLYRPDGAFMAHADCPVADALRTGRPQRNVEAVIERPDGSRKFILANIDALRDEGGAVVGAVNILQDISDRKQAEAALRQSEQRFRSLLDDLPAAGYTCDAQGHITYFNRRAVELWGREPRLDDPADRYCGSFKLFSPGGSPIAHDECWMALALRDRREYNGQEIVVERPDGSRRIALAHANPFHDESGRLVGAVNVLVDITDQKRTEAALQASEGQLRLVADHAPVFLAHCDPEGRYKFVNKGYAARFGLTPQDVIGRRIPDVVGERAYASFRRHVEAALAGQQVEFEVEIPYERIGRHVMRCAYSPEFGPDGQVRGIVAVIADVTDRKRAEEALRASEEHLRAVVETTPACIKIVAADGTLLDMNSAGLAMVEVDRPEHVKGKCVYNLICEEYRDAFREFNERVCRGERGSLEFEIVGLRGTRRRMETHAVPLRRADGSLVQLAITQDVTERKRAEEALRHSEERFRSLMEQAPFSIQVFSPDGRTIRANRAWEDLSGARSEQIEGYNVLEDRQLEARGVLPYIRQGFAGQATRIPAIQYNPNGTIPDVTQEVDPRRWLSAVIYPLKDAEGRVREVVLIHEDITARHRAEEALLEAHRELETRVAQRTAELVRANEFLKALLENVQTGIVACDAAGILTLFNSVTRAMHGLPEEPLPPDRWANKYRLYRPDGETLMAVEDVPLYRALQGERVANAEMVIRAEGLPPRTVLAAGQAFYDHQGGKLGAVVSMHDITQRKQAEEALRKAHEELERRVEERTVELAHANEALRDADRRKDEFLATLAHELRNPLAPIRNSLQILKMPRVDAVTACQTREMMERQVHHLVRLVDDLLDVSRVMRGKIELRREPVELATVVARAVETAKPLIEVQGHELDISLPPESLLLDADPVRLAQVVGNLLTNSAKYSEANGHIWLTARREGAQAVLSVRDNGIGIAPDLLPHVFELFVQADHATTKAQGGLGIGLTLVKNLVEMHGGTVEARSAGLGKGSEFVARLPLLVRPQVVPGESESAAQEQATPSSGHRLLVVDDNHDAAVSLSMLLRLQGHEVRVAHDGPTALVIATTFRPDLIFLDIGMPGMDGYEVARRMREQPGLGKVVLAALTGWGQQEDRRRSAEAGFDHHLVKPLEPTALGRVLAELKGPQVR